MQVPTFVICRESLIVRSIMNAMNLRRAIVILSSIVFFSGCAPGDREGVSISSARFYFRESQSGWTGGFVNYAKADSAVSELYFGYENLPQNLAINQKSLMLSGKNIGQKLTMFIKKKITGLAPDTDYTLVYDVMFASNVNKGTPSADSVTVITGSFSQEPIPVESEGYYLLGTSYGPLSGSYYQLGSIANTNAIPEYDYVDVGNATSKYPYIKGRTNSLGELWLFVGVDSLYKGTTTIYFTSVEVTFSTS
jgi:hypothetical protein